MSAEGSARGRTLGLVTRAVQVRLRFIAVLVAASLVVGQWDTLRNYWDHAVRLATGTTPAPQGVSSDTEYFCPMDPGVISEWPSKCGICNMTLVRRKRGDATPLPSGVVARMQISPYRLQLAGVRTSPVGYQPLAREAVLSGVATKDGVEADAGDGDLRWIAEGQDAEITADGHAPMAGKVVAASASGRVRMTVDGHEPMLKPGTAVIARVRRAVADMEPFRSLPADPPALRKGELRSVYVCPEHAEVLRDKPGKCPIDKETALEPQPLQSTQRVGYWCPMHPKVTAETPGEKCAECGGMTLVPRVVGYRPKGQVLTVPESAVIDTGTRTVVYVERMPGMFDGIEVVLGPRCGDNYPVAAGLEPGQNVASAGAFLIDAETRLNPSLASAYFGAARGSRPEEAKVETGPSREDAALIARQKICPVTGKKLGSMGTPVKVDVSGRMVMICCDGCEEALKAAPQKYLPRLPAPDAR